MQLSWLEEREKESDVKTYTSEAELSNVLCPLLVV